MKRVHFETDETYFRRKKIRFVLAQLCLHLKYDWILGFKYVDTFERLENKIIRYDFSITSLLICSAILSLKRYKEMTKSDSNTI